MDLPRYHHLLQKCKDTALLRLQQDLDREAREKEEDGCAEESRLNSLSGLGHRRQIHRQSFLTESLRSVQALKSKHAQEVAVLEQRHNAAAIALKENIEYQERELEEHFDKQSKALNYALVHAFAQRMEARKMERIKLDGRRYMEDNSLRSEVFQAFAKEALAVPKRFLDSKISLCEPGFVEMIGRDWNIMVCKKETNEQESTSILGTVAEIVATEPVRQPIKFRLAGDRHSSKRQKTEPRSPANLQANFEQLPSKTSFKLKSFSCGSATWQHSPNLLVKPNTESHTFEIYHGKNSLSAMHPDWVLDDKPGQTGFYNTDESTFELEREGRITIWLKFMFLSELSAFLDQYRAYFDEIVPITGS